MTKEELEQYGNLNSKFNEDCRRICEKLEKLDDDFHYVDEFVFDGPTVECAGDEYGSYGYYERRHGYFNSDLLTYTDKELEEYVAKKIEEKRKIEEEKEKEDLKNQRKKDLADYKKLKKKLGL